MLISERIFQCMEEKGMTQKEFVEKTGIPQSTVSGWKHSGTNPTAEKIIVICDVLGISPYVLLEGEERIVENKEECVIIRKNSQEYQMIKEYRELDADRRRRLQGYMEALSGK